MNMYTFHISDYSMAVIITILKNRSGIAWLNTRVL